MSVFLVGISTLASFFKMILLLLLFIAILAGCYYFTRWYARSGVVRQSGRNISVLENHPMGPNKSVAIVKMGSRYFAVAIGKDDLHMIAELSEDEINAQPANVPTAEFKDVFGELLQKGSKFAKNKKDTWKK